MKSDISSQLFNYALYTINYTVLFTPFWVRNLIYLTSLHLWHGTLTWNSSDKKQGEPRRLKKGAGGAVANECLRWLKDTPAWGRGGGGGCTTAATRSGRAVGKITIHFFLQVWGEGLWGWPFGNFETGLRWVFFVAVVYLTLFLNQHHSLLWKT